MKRKEFIRNISLVGAGISLAPTRLFAFSDQFRIALPDHAVHIPHGNFANTDLERIRIAELDVEVSVQHFMRNGINASQEDVSVFTFCRDNEFLNVCFDDEGCHTAGKISKLETSHSKNRFSLTNTRFEVELIAGCSHLTVRKV